MPWIPVQIEDESTQSVYRGLLGSTATAASALAFTLWTYSEALKEKANPLFWGCVGFFLGIWGVIVFYGYFCLQHLKARTNTPV